MENLTKAVEKTGMVENFTFQIFIVLSIFTSLHVWKKELEFL